jgi:hypothetical protein
MGVKVKSIRIISTIVGIIFFLALTQHASAITKAEYQQGSFLFHACQAANYSHPTSSDAEQGSICLSYLEGFTDGADSVGNGLCAGRSSYGEMAAAYVTWMKKHPKVMSMDKRIGVLLALRAAYPCSTASH